MIFTSLIIQLISLITNCYPYTQRSFPQNFSTEVFLVACNRSWIILASIPFADALSYSQDLFKLRSGWSEYRVDVHCFNQGTALLLFASPVCEARHVQINEGKVEYPIAFRLYGKGYKENEIYVSKCLRGSIDRASVEMGYISDQVWYLLKRREIKGKDVEVGLMIFGRDFHQDDLEDIVNETMIQINEIHFDNTLVYHDLDIIRRDSASTCEWLMCNEKITTEMTTVAPVPERPKAQYDLVLFLLMAIPVGLCLVGLV